jgi:hypothetical protein
MRKKYTGFPDEFSALPLLSLVPSIGDVNKIELFSVAMFARYEKIMGLIESCEQDTTIDPEYVNKLRTERSMLHEVLDWLAIAPVDESKYE